MEKFKGKAALVTGGAAGIGKAIAERLTKDGAIVVIADVNENDGQIIAQSLNGHFIKTDVTDAAAVKSAIQYTVSCLQQLDILVNNAGTESAQAPIHLSTLEDWHQVINVNLNGMFYGMKYGLEQFLKQGTAGVIVNMVSIAGLVGFPGLPSYNASKAAVVNLTREAAIEYGKHHIRVNAVAPTAVHSQMLQRYIDASADPEATKVIVENMNPFPGLPTPEDVAAVVAFLASDDARFVTGVTIPVDGGYTAQ